jgi:RNA polymerase primary sigma factor
MSSFVWPSEDGWPYPDTEAVGRVEVEDPYDDDAMALRVANTRLLSRLDPLERQVLAARFGLDGAPVRSMKELGADLGLPRADVRQALGSGLTKLRAQLTE